MMITTEIKRRERGEEELKVERIYNSLILLESLFKGRARGEDEYPRYEELNGHELYCQQPNEFVSYPSCILLGYMQISRKRLEVDIVFSPYYLRTNKDEKGYLTARLGAQISDRLKSRFEIYTAEWFTGLYTRVKSSREFGIREYKRRSAFSSFYF